MAKLRRLPRRIDPRQGGGIYVPSLARMSCGIVVVIALVLGGMAKGESPATAPKPGGAEPAENSTPAKEAALKPEDVAKRLAEVQRVLDVSKGSGDTASPPAQLLRQVELLKQLERDFAQQAASRGVQEEHSTAKLDLSEKIAALRAHGPIEERPFSFLLLDRLREELDSEIVRKSAYSAAVRSAEDALNRERAILAEKERQLRRDKEAAETNQDETAAARLAASLSLAELERQVFQELTRLREIELINERLALDVHQLRITFLQEKAEWVSKDAVFTKRDLQDQLTEIEIQESELNKLLQAKEANLGYLEQQWFDSRRRIEHEAQDNPALVEQVETDHLAWQAQQQEVSTLNQRLQRLGEMQTVWNRRCEIVIGTINESDRQTWKQETERAIERLNREARVQSSMIEEHRKNLATLDGKRQGAKQQSSDYVRSLDEQEKQFHDLIRVHETNLVSIETTLRLHKKLLLELRDGRKEGFNARAWLMSAWLGVVRFWDYEITEVDNRPITVKKIVEGMILAGIGFLISRALSRLFGRRFLPRLGADESTSAALQSISFYLLVTTFTLFALQIVHIPLTVFTVLGGAVALGVGFGSQNIVNNFISGLILHAERPVRVGDLIQFNDQFGVVEEIGPRSTRVITPANLEVIVPNSALLESNVVNWTLSNRIIRSRVKVGVAYGSPTRELSRLLIQAAAEVDGVIQTPEPFVLFTDFAENSLNFELHFWVQMSTITEHQRIESEIRYRIDESFARAGISMPFPQRDVHLALSRPLDVRLDVHGQQIASDVMRNVA